MSTAFSFQRGVTWAIQANPGRSLAPLSPRLPAAFAEIGRSSLAELAGAMGLPSPDPILQRFEAGGRCFAFWVDNQIACYCWVAQGREWIGEMEIHFQIGAGERYIWDCFTRPAFRRQGLYSALLAHMVRELQREGVARLWIGSNLENRPSLKGFERAGFQPVVQIWFLRLLSLRWYWIRSCPAAPKELVSAARRAFAAEHALQIAPFIIKTF